MEFFLVLYWLGMAYLIGSFPFGLLFAKAAAGIDPRLAGSGNVGATNVARLAGTPWGVATLVCDIAKGFLPVLMAMSFTHNWLFLSLIALAAILGHMFSVFLDYQGGKAVATTIGVFLALAPLPLLVSVLACVAVIAASGYVSLGSMTMAAALPICMVLFWKPGLIPVSLAVCALIFWRHQANIERLRRGEEKSWRKGR